MATIALYANKINQMPGLIKDIKKTVSGYKSELSSLKTKTLTINKSVCNLDDVISSIQSSSQTQEQKIASLDAFNQNSEQFISDTARIDSDVADVVKQRQDDFYDKYNYLKPECEKSNWEKFCDGLKKVGEWCKEHWKLIVTVIIVIAAIALIVCTAGMALGPIATILVGAAKGLIVGAIIGGLMGGLSSVASGGSFLDGFEDGAFAGALTGALFGGLGGLGQVAGNGIKCVSALGKTISVVSKVSGAISLTMGGFDILSFGIGLFDPQNPLVQFNQKLHSSKLYNAFQIGVSALAVFSAGAASTMKCFVAGTMVLTAAGFVAIENIKAGNKVISTNFDTFEVAEKTVLETYIRETTELVHLTINGELIKTTHDHPFYVKDVGFINAGELNIGNQLLDSNGNMLIVEDRKVEILDEPVKVFNFQVEEFHTYHVGENEILVHNAGADYGKSYTPEQQKVVKEGKEISKSGQTTQTEAENYVNKCREVGIGSDKVRIDPGHMDRMNPNVPAEGVSGQPHLHVPSGKNSHIPIIGD